MPDQVRLPAPRSPRALVRNLEQQVGKIADRAEGYAQRARSARNGLWGNHGYEAAYAQVYDDADGAQLDGHGRYELRFATPPPGRVQWPTKWRPANGPAVSGRRVPSWSGDISQPSIAP